MQILYVENDEQVLEETAEMCLELAQVESIEAFTEQEEVLEWLEDKENQADLALLTIDMPRLNGLELAEKIQLKRPDMKTGKEVDMGSPFDFFGEISHPGYQGVTEEQFENRMTLQRIMKRSGFRPLDCEWWHFTLEEEPYPDTYFDFPVCAASLRR